ncbi:MAG: response regulator [Candidatus Auribacter fodinae]|jgi:CheY-like chemotaxis protein|uniref:Response regulator n=1 Tax=Candidatus Auribacter fodinae TaxID=2093366 RepID=A0A3A4RAA5_9BACT|nr:MAG: response regulator [Candidatus Auribacter fodinae]
MRDRSYGDMRKKIVVADENRLIQNMLSRFLVKFGYDVICVDRGDEAYKIIMSLIDAKMSPAAIICDLDMPDCNGLELVRSLIADCIDIPTVLMTDENHHEDIEELSRKITLKRVQKPVEISDIIDFIKEYD